MGSRWLVVAGRVKEAAAAASGLHSRPWSTTQLRHLKVNAIHLRTGNVIEKSGRIYQVVEAEHRQRGRGGATMTLELRDVDSGSKTSLRFGTEEAVERVFVEEKPFTCLYKEQDTAYLMDTQKFEQLEVPLIVFGKYAAYLKEDLKVKLQIYDGRPLSGSVPKQVTCSIKEKQELLSGTVNPRSVKAVMDNGLSIQIQFGLHNLGSSSETSGYLHIYRLVTKLLSIPRMTLMLAGHRGLQMRNRPWWNSSVFKAEKKDFK